MSPMGTTVICSPDPMIQSGMSTGIGARPQPADPQTIRSTLVMISPDLDGSTTSGRYSLGSIEAQNWVGSLSEIERYLGTLKNQADSIGAVVVSAGYGSEISRLVSALRHICPQAPLVACGRNLFGHILPPTPKDLSTIPWFDFVIRNNSEIPTVRLMTTAGASIHVFHTRRIPGTCRPILLEDPEKPLPELQHIPWTVKDACDQLQLNRQINQRIQDRYYADRFVIVAALPKSASSVIGSCVSVVQTGAQSSRKYGSYMLNNQDSDLRPEILRDFPEGGVVKYHPAASGKNLKVLDLLGCRYLIILRDPADHVAALYANALNSSRNNISKYATMYDHICPLPRALFDESMPMDNTFDYLIRGGSLLSRYKLNNGNWL